MLDNDEHGKGLFATNGTSNGDVVFNKGERIIQYNGEVLNKAELGTDTVGSGSGSGLGARLQPQQRNSHVGVPIACAKTNTIPIRKIYCSNTG